ncbi:MAG: hypothetical protein ACRC8A_18735 [Microcoleaceae cyanobacterium]
MIQPISSSFSTASSQSEISPQLQSVLGCLDVQLEEELTRYRRQRKRIKQISLDPANTQHAHKPSQVLAVTSDDSRLEPSAGSTSADSNRVGQTLGTATSPAGWESVVMNTEAAPLVPRTQVQSGSTQGFHSLGTSSARANSLRTNSSRASSTSSGSEQYLTPPEDYLESSEALVKTIDQPRARVRGQRSSIASLLSPLGIVSMLLLLGSCMTLGYVVMSPNGRATLGLNRFFKAGDPETLPQPSSGNTAAPVSSSPGSSAQSPNLAAQEFVDLDLNTLSNVNPSPSPIPAPVVSPANPLNPPQNLAPPTLQPTGPSLNNLSKELLPEPQAPATQAAATPSPQPAAGATPPANQANQSANQPQTEPTRAVDGLYYVVVPYSDVSSLEKARVIVPDAYVREFKAGTQIQLGALDTQTAAQQLAKELSDRGLSPQFDIPTAGE